MASVFSPSLRVSVSGCAIMTSVQRSASVRQHQQATSFAGHVFPIITVAGHLLSTRCKLTQLRCLLVHCVIGCSRAVARWPLKRRTRRPPAGLCMRWACVTNTTFSGHLLSTRLKLSCLPVHCVTCYTGAVVLCLFSALSKRFGDTNAPGFCYIEEDHEARARCRRGLAQRHQSSPHRCESQSLNALPSLANC